MATGFSDTQIGMGRRWSDGPGSLDISQMIASEDDPKQRAFLIVLHSINQSLEANTSTVREISDKLEVHLEAFNEHTAEGEKMMNQGRGAWKIAAWVIGFAQILATGAWVTQRSEMTALAATIHAEVLTQAEMKGRVDSIEKVMQTHITDATRK